MYNEEINTEGEDIDSFIEILKKTYPAFKGATSSDCVQPFSKTYPEFFMVADDEGYDYEFLMRDKQKIFFLRGCLAFPNNGLVPFLEKNFPYPGAAVKKAVEEDYYGYVIKWGCHPEVMDVPSIAELTGDFEQKGFSVSPTEDSDPKSLTELSGGRHPEHAVFRDK